MIANGRSEAQLKTLEVTKYHTREPADLSEVLTYVGYIKTNNKINQSINDIVEVKKTNRIVGVIKLNFKFLDEKTVRFFISHW